MTPSRYSLLRFPHMEDADTASLHGAEVGHPGWVEILASGNGCERVERELAE